MRIGTYHTIECESDEYIFFSEKLQLYKLNSEFKEFIKTNNFKSDIFEATYSNIRSQQIGAFIKKKLELHPPPDFAAIKNGINSLILNVSGTKCNLKCNYCFASPEQNYSLSVMDFETAKKAIDFLLLTNPNEEYYGIVFFGGEPFINYNLITEIANYCEETITKKNGKEYSLSATTNGTILNQQLINVFQKQGSVIFVSLDGPKQIHNKNRPYHNMKGSFSKIMSNIELLKKANINYSFRPTITADCINLVEIVDFFENLKTEFSFEFALKPNFKFSHSAEYNNEKIQNIKAQYTILMEYFYNKVKKNEQIYCNNIISALKRIHFRQGKKWACTAGESILTVNSDNTIYSCQNLSTVHATNIGNLDIGINELKLKEFTVPEVNTLGACYNCWVKYLCGGGCFAEKYTENKTITEPIKNKCQLKKIRWEQHIKLYIKIRNYNPDYFKNIREINAI